MHKVAEGELSNHGKMSKEKNHHPRPKKTFIWVRIHWLQIQMGQVLQHKPKQRATTTLGRGCSTLLEHTPVEKKPLKVLGSIPARCWAFFFSFYPSEVSLIRFHDEVQHF